MASAPSLLKKFNNTKTLPHVAIRLSKMISDENSTVQDLEEVIRLDPTLVLRLMRLVNSSYYSLREKVESISRAVVFIGLKNLRNMVVLEALKDIFKKKEGKDNGFSRSQLWLHSAAVSIGSQMISERVFGIKGEDAFLCGILHDIGMIVEEQVAQPLFQQACESFTPATQTFPQVEKEVIGTNHSAIGSLLARDWRFPAEVQEGIKNHHKELAEVEPSSISGIIQTSEYLVSRLNYRAMEGMNGMLSPPLAKHIHGNLEEYKTLTRDLPGEMLKAKELYEFQSE
jgi:putative nucleotidyltransferase with HDIG domain